MSKSAAKPAKPANRAALKWGLSIFGALLFAYVFLRALLISYTPDEATTYYFAIGKFNHLVHSNNHILNTQLMRITHALLGPSEWSLRLPNVLSFVLFLSAVWLIIRRNAHPWFALLGFGLIALNPFMLEFFSLARGYGLSIAFSMMGFALLIEARERPERRFQLHLAIILAAFLAVISNFNAVNFVLILFAWIIIDQIRGSKKWSGRHLGLALAMLITLAVAVGALLVLRSNGDLRFGAPSYYSAYIRTARLMIYVDDQPLWFTEWVGMVLLIAIIAMVAFVLIKRKYFSHFAIALSLLVGIPFGWFIEHEVFGANLPQGRMLLNLLPVFGASLYFFFCELIQWNEFGKRERLIKVFSGIALLAFLINFGLSLNLHTTHKWPDSAKTKEAIIFVGEKVKDWERPATFERFNIYRNSTNYYISTRDLNIELTENKEIFGNADILFVHEWEWERVEPLLGDRYQIIWSEPNYPMRVYQSNSSMEANKTLR